MHNFFEYFVLYYIYISAVTLSIALRWYIILYNIILYYISLSYIYIYIYILFSHLTDAFIQSDLQMRTTEAINCSIKTTKNRSQTKS